MQKQLVLSAREDQRGIGGEGPGRRTRQACRPCRKLRRVDCACVCAHVYTCKRLKQPQDQQWLIILES